MDRFWTAICLTTVLLCSSAAAAEQLCEEVELPLRFDGIVYRCGSASALKMMRYLWAPIQMHLRCTRSNYPVYVANNLEELAAKFEAKESAWCGMARFSDARACHKELSPFWVTYVGTPSRDAGQCELDARAETSAALVATGAAGVLLFSLADVLSTSQMFRLGAGSMVFTSGSLIILLVLLFRLLPNKRGVAAVGAAMGGTGLTLLRWLYGYWLPPLSTLLRSRLALAYVLSSLLTGAAVTYYYDDRSNAKLNTIIRSALQLLGLYCVYHSAWTLPELAAAAVAGLVAVRLLLPLLGGRLLPARFRRRQQQQRRNNGGRRVTFNEFVEVEDYYPASAPARSTAPRFSDGTPLHLRASPPAPWTTGHAAVEARPPSSASGSKSPAGGSRGAAAAAQATPPPRINLSAELDKVSPLVKSGIILNTATGRTIKIGGAVYNKLVEQGYSPDAARGVLTPPPPATAARDGGLGSPRGQRATPAAGGSRLAPKSPRSHAISPAGSSGGATTGGGSVGSTPAAALRRRRSTSSADEFL